MKRLKELKQDADHIEKQNKEPILHEHYQGYNCRHFFAPIEKDNTSQQSDETPFDWSEIDWSKSVFRGGFTCQGTYKPANHKND